MIERFSQGKLLWISLKNPTAEEVREVMNETSFPPALMGDLTTPVPRGYVVAQDDALKITMNFPVVKRIDSAHPYEVKFLILKNTLITVQYEEMEAMDRFKKQFEVIATLHKASKRTTGIHLFFGLLSELYTATATKLDYVESKLADIEAEIFNDNEKQMVVDIALAGKKLIAFRHTIRTHEDIFHSARTLLETLSKDTFVSELENIQSQYLIITRRVNTLFETLTALRETNAAMLTTKQNEIMKTFTILAFITFPLTLLSSMFGMNTVNTPIIGAEADFWIILSIMFTITIALFTYFKHRKWM